MQKGVKWRRNVGEGRGRKANKHCLLGGRENEKDSSVSPKRGEVREENEYSIRGWSFHANGKELTYWVKREGGREMRHWKKKKKGRACGGGDNDMVVGGGGGRLSLEFHQNRHSKFIEMVRR